MTIFISILIVCILIYFQGREKINAFIQKKFPKFKGFSNVQQEQCYTNDPNEWYNENKKRNNDEYVSDWKTEHEKNEEEFLKIMNIITDDFLRAPYKHKFNDTFGYKNNYNSLHWIYKLENGLTFEFKSDNLKKFQIIFDNKVLTFGILYANGIVDVLKKMVDKAKIQNDYSRTKSEPKEYESKLRKLINNYNLRKGQLDGMTKDDPNRKSLENEIKIVQSKISILRKQKLDGILNDK